MRSGRGKLTKGALRSVRHLNEEDSISASPPDISQHHNVRRVKRKASAADLDQHQATICLQQSHKRQKRLKETTNLFEGLSKKEILEAQGFDETWTEYSIFLLERPCSGVFLTPLGRCRPAGKRQGRPRKSRIAVFKSPKIRDLSWFVGVETASGPSTPTLTADHLPNEDGGYLVE